MAVRARQALDFRGVLAATGRPTIEIALGRPTHQHEGAVAEDGIVDRLQRLHERNIPIPTGMSRRALVVLGRASGAVADHASATARR